MIVQIWEWFNTQRIIVLAVLGLVIIALWVGGSNEIRKAKEEERKHD